MEKDHLKVAEFFGLWILIAIVGGIAYNIIPQIKPVFDLSLIFLSAYFVMRKIQQLVRFLKRVSIAIGRVLNRRKFSNQ